jgi:hypothetical protein
VPHHIRRATPLIAVDFEILALSDATTRLHALPAEARKAARRQLGLPAFDRDPQAERRAKRGETRQTFRAELLANFRPADLVARPSSTSPPAQ